MNSAKVAPFPPPTRPNNEAAEIQEGPAFGTELASSRYRNSEGKLSNNNMRKASELVKWNDSIFRRIYAIIKRNVCPTAPKCEFNLGNYTDKLFSATRAPDNELRDIIRQLFVVRQILQGTRTITKDSIPIFQNSYGGLFLSVTATLITCGVGVFVGMGTAFGVGMDVVMDLEQMGYSSEGYREWLQYNPEPSMENVNAAVDPSTSDSIKEKLLDKAKDKWKIAGQRAAFRAAIATEEGSRIWMPLTLGTGTGLATLGFGAIVGGPILAGAAGVVTPALKLGRYVCKKVNLYQLTSEITYILLVAEQYYPEIYRSVEEEVRPDPRRGETSAQMATFLERPNQSERRQQLSNFTAGSGSTRGGKRYNVRKVRKLRKTRKTRRHR